MTPQVAALVLGALICSWAAALRRSPVPSPLAAVPARSFVAGRGPRWSRNLAPARAGRGGWAEKPCRCILFSKKIKYFHGKISLCVFLSPRFSLSIHFFWVVFQGQFHVSVPRVSPTLASLASTVDLAPGPWPGTPLHAICAALSLTRGQEGGLRMAVWPQVRGESQQPISQLCLLLFWPSRAPDTPWACMGGHLAPSGISCCWPCGPKIQNLQMMGLGYWLHFPLSVSLLSLLSLDLVPR